MSKPRQFLTIVGLLFILFSLINPVAGITISDEMGPRLFLSDDEDERGGALSGNAMQQADNNLGQSQSASEALATDRVFNRPNPSIEIDPRNYPQYCSDPDHYDDTNDISGIQTTATAERNDNVPNADTCIMSINEFRDKQMNESNPGEMTTKYPYYRCTPTMNLISNPTGGDDDEGGGSVTGGGGGGAVTADGGNSDDDNSQQTYSGYSGSYSNSQSNDAVSELTDDDGIVRVGDGCPRLLDRDGHWIPQQGTGNWQDGDFDGQVASRPYSALYAFSNATRPTYGRYGELNFEAIRSHRQRLAPVRIRDQGEMWVGTDYRLREWTLWTGPVFDSPAEGCRVDYELNRHRIDEDPGRYYNDYEVHRKVAYSDPNDVVSREPITNDEGKVTGYRVTYDRDYYIETRQSGEQTCHLYDIRDHWVNYTVKNKKTGNVIGEKDMADWGATSLNYNIQNKPDGPFIIRVNTEVTTENEHRTLIREGEYSTESRSWDWDVEEDTTEITYDRGVNSAARKRVLLDSQQDLAIKEVVVETPSVGNSSYVFINGPRGDDGGALLNQRRMWSRMYFDGYPSQSVTNIWGTYSKTRYEKYQVKEGTDQNVGADNVREEETTVLIPEMFTTPVRLTPAIQSEPRRIRFENAIENNETPSVSPRVTNVTSIDVNGNGYEDTGQRVPMQDEVHVRSLERQLPQMMHIKNAPGEISRVESVTGEEIPHETIRVRGVRPNIDITNINMSHARVTVTRPGGGPATGPVQLIGAERFQVELTPEMNGEIIVEKAGPHLSVRTTASGRDSIRQRFAPNYKLTRDEYTSSSTTNNNCRKAGRTNCPNAAQSQSQPTVLLPASADKTFYYSNPIIIDLTFDLILALIYASPLATFYWLVGYMRRGIEEDYSG